MQSLSVRFRAGALLATGAYGIHQLRYLLAYGDHSHEQLASQGHAYLTVLGPALAGLTALAAVEFLARLVRARRRSGPDRPLSRPSTLWGLATGWLLAVYVAQESLEGQLAAGHPAGLTGILGHGGWLAILLSAAVGAVVALALRGASAAIELAAGGTGYRVRQWKRASTTLPAIFQKPALDPVSLFLAARGPPLTSR
jgi:hypothetical protein